MKRRKIPDEEWVLAFDKLCRYFNVSRSMMPGAAADEIIRQSEKAAAYVREERAHMFIRVMDAEKALKEHVCPSSESTKSSSASTTTPPSSSRRTRSGKPAARRQSGTTADS